MTNECVAVNDIVNLLQILAPFSLFTFATCLFYWFNKFTNIVFFVSNYLDRKRNSRGQI